MKDAALKVAAFMQKMGYEKKPYNAQPFDPDTRKALSAAAFSCATVSKQLEETGSISRADVLRAHLILEEVSELLSALLGYDAPGILDALADLAYVVVGSGLHLDLPLVEAFDVVHSANMLKERRRGDERIRNKGEGWIDPYGAIAQLITDHRAQQAEDRIERNPL